MCLVKTTMATILQVQITLRGVRSLSRSDYEEIVELLSIPGAFTSVVNCLFSECAPTYHVKLSCSAARFDSAQSPSPTTSELDRLIVAGVAAGQVRSRRSFPAMNVCTRLRCR